MKIFLSYSSEDKDIAEKIFLALLESGHKVFYDRDKLQAGKSYHKTIENELHTSDLLIFLISPYSIKPSSYTLTEIKYAQKKWKHPKNHVLPVMVKSTNYKEIPNYIMAVTIFTPSGNIPAEVVSEVDSFNQSENKIGFNVKYLVASTSIIIISLAVYYITPPAQQPDGNTKYVKISANNNESKNIEYSADKQCINQYIQDNKINNIEIGSKDFRIQLNNEKQITLQLRENANLLAIVVLNIFTENKIFKINSITDNNCNQIIEFFNSSAGGDKYILNDWDTLGININGTKYFLRLGYVEGSIEINSFYAEK